LTIHHLHARIKSISAATATDLTSSGRMVWLKGDMWIYGRRRKLML
jgi:hypothetical protein